MSVPVFRTNDGVMVVGPISAGEQVELAEAEAVLERFRETSVEAGFALLRIRDRHLYRGTHPTFEAYVRDRWGFNRDWAYKQIAAASVSADVSTSIQLTRSQLQELAVLPSEERQALAELVEGKSVRETREIVAEHRQAVQEQERLAEREREVGFRKSQREWAKRMLQTFRQQTRWNIHALEQLRPSDKANALKTIHALRETLDEAARILEGDL